MDPVDKNKYINEKMGKHFLSIESQAINVEAMMKLEKKLKFGGNCNVLFRQESSKDDKIS